MVKWIVAVLIICLYTVSCGKVLEDASTSDKEPRGMDWFYKHNGYAIMTIVDTDNRPVMDVSST